MFQISPNRTLTREVFEKLLKGNLTFSISQESILALNESRQFIDKLLKTNSVVYGLTTGFADLRNKSVEPEKAAQLSRNIIISHDAGIGPNLSDEIVLGAMIIRANALGKGHSGFQYSSLQTLVQMVNAKIIPEIPCCGSLGASGDLALLSRLGRAMMGEDVPVKYQGKTTSASKALNAEKIPYFRPEAKEGLALTNGTSFMASMGAIALSKEISLLETYLAFLPLFLDSVQAIDAAFTPPIHEVRGQKGQAWVASVLYEKMQTSPFINSKGSQNDYCIRCIPQILGPKIDLLCSISPWILNELDAVTDNPIIFSGENLKGKIKDERIFTIENQSWAVLSGGNFHGEYSTTAADAIGLINAKVGLLIERQMTYMLNPFRNHHQLPAYLISDEANAGLLSGYMITQYTGNDLAQRIAALGAPTGIYNITSANESEDVVSYGSTAFQRILSQLDLLENHLAIFITIVMQAYALRCRKSNLNPKSYSQELFSAVEEKIQIFHPYEKEDNFILRYNLAKEVIQSDLARKTLGFPLENLIK